MVAATPPVFLGPPRHGDAPLAGANALPATAHAGAAA